MGKITYLDKVALNENTDIPDINKVTASDMTEIKNVVNGLVKTGQTTTDEETYSCNYINNLGNYSTDGKPYKTGRKINGKDEYVIESNIGALPNKTYKNLNSYFFNDVSGLNLNNIIIHDMNGYGERIAQNDYNWRPLTFINPGNVSIGIGIYISSNTIFVYTGEDYTTYTGHCRIYYTLRD